MLIIPKTKTIPNTLLITILTFLLNHTPITILKFILLILDVTTYWIKNILNFLTHSPEKQLLKQLQDSKNYSEFVQVGSKLDKLNGNDIWRQNLVSKKYDYKLIQERLIELNTSRLTNDYLKVSSLLRSGMLRNFGGISNKRLYNKSFIGTKILIENYIKEFKDCLNYLDLLNNFKTDNAAYGNDLFQKKLDFFHDSKQTLGTTALILQGGTLFGLCHIGVIKGLYEGKLLPNVIAGSSIGAVVGSLICCLDEIELLKVLKNLTKEIDIEIKNGRVKLNEFNWIENLKKGFSQDMIIFIEFVMLKIGNLTFKEIFKKNGRILNIVIYPTNNEIPNLLNYLSTPYVTIKSAILCSLGNGVLEENVKLKIKLENNSEIDYLNKYKFCEFLPPYYARSINYSTKYNDSKYFELKSSPYTRLTEMFNVNHFIVSLARPYLAPLISNDWSKKKSKFTIIKKLENIVSLEIRHRIEMFDKFGLLFSFMKWVVSDEKVPLYDTNHIPIVPEMKTLIWDFIRLFDINKYDENIPYWIQVGERSAWEMYPMLKMRCSIEFSLDDYYNKYRN